MQQGSQDPLETFFRQSGIDAAPPERRKATRSVIFGTFILLLLLFGGRLVTLYTDWLWFTHDAQQPQVFAKEVGTRAALWLGAFAIAATAFLLNFARPLRAVAVYRGVPESQPELMAANALRSVQASGRAIAIALATVLALLFAGGLGSRHEQLWWYQNAADFGRKDPIFGLDLGFFVFQLPWLQSLTGFAAGILVTCMIVVGAAYLGLRSLAQVARAEIDQSAIRTHVSWLAGLTLIAFGAGAYLGRYDAGVVQNTQFVGPGYAQIQGLPVGLAIAVLTIVVGVLTIVNGFLWRPYRVPMVGVPALVVLSLLGSGLYPSILQRLVVEPNKLQVESLYAKRAIESTRAAFGIDRFAVKDFAVQDEPTTAEIETADSTLANMRLWDPVVVQRSIDGLQSLRPYYNFADVDIDRYDIGGDQRMVMLSARDIDTSGLSSSARTWLNQRLQYTHGFGLVMIPVNESTPSGAPEFLIKDFPPRGPAGLEVKQPRIYFSDSSGRGHSDYAIVNTKVDEFDYPSQREDQSYRWTGGRGVPVGGLLAKAVYSLSFGDGNLLVSPNLTDKSRMLYRRNVRERAELVYPMLAFDTDPYVVLFQGRMLWLMNGYTTSDRLPYSALVQGPLGRVNYVRNAVKVVVDAYSGQMNAYALDEQDPILRAYRRIFPGLIRDRAEAPKGLDQHFRYGEDLFKYQASVLTQYHVTNEQAFLNNEDAWDLPKERGRTGQAELMLPYYVQMRLPGDARDAFMLILPFTPRQKDNMIGWMAAHCDPENFGEVVLYKFPKDSQTPGPIQMEAIFDQDREIADINRQLNNEQSEIVRGNLLVIPIGSSVMYVKPLFLQSRTRPIPELKKVAIGLQERVVVADTYEQALAKLFPSGAVAPPREIGEERVREAPDRQPIELNAVRAVLRLMDQAEAALRQGDLARYGELQRQAREQLRQLAR
jgi:uncharacterized membrane protein (UPF0182 family)